MPRKSSTSRRWPVVVKVGSAEAKIYRREKNDREYFILTHHEGGARKQRRFADYGTARTAADLVVAKITSSQVAAPKLGDQERDDHARALLLLQSSGIPLHAALEEFVAAKKTLGAFSLLHAAEDYVCRHQENLPEMLIPVLEAEGLAAQPKEGMTEKHQATGENTPRDWRERMPMCPPFLFLDTAVLTDDGARGSYTITGRENALRGHFKHRPIMPASLMIEALGQLGVFFLLNHANAKQAAGGIVRPDSVFFVSCDGVRCSRVCQPGDQLNLKITAGRLRSPLVNFSGSITVATHRAVRAEEIVLSFGA